MRTHGQSVYRDTQIVPRSELSEGFFGRIFRKLPAFDPPGATEAEKVQFFADLAASMVEPEGSEEDPSFDNPDIPSGYTYFGQFVDHDITFDPTSSLERQNDPNLLQNFRTPRFDLDSLYGRGPDDHPFLYDNSRDGNGRLMSSAKFLIGQGFGENEPDLPRNEQGIALIGDPRNDENIIVSQLQLAFLKFHNAVVDHLHSTRGLQGDALFLEAQRMVRWHYQWVVIHDFLKRIVGAEIVDSILPQEPGGPIRNQFYKWNRQPFMPVEFSVAAYRLGHSMVRNAYSLNRILDQLRAGIDGGKIPLFSLAQQVGDLDDLRGGRRLPAFWTLQWNQFFEIDGSNPQKSRLLDPELAQALTKLPPDAQGNRNPLALRNLLRGWRMALPSGQRIAKKMGVAPIQQGETPLWSYILNEAALPESTGGGGGRRLGPVGGRIVAEVFVGLLAGDPLSYLNIEPKWQPELPSENGEFQLRDILRFAQVPLTESDLPF